MQRGVVIPRFAALGVTAMSSTIMANAGPALKLSVRATRQAALHWLLRQERRHDHETWRFILLGWIGSIGMPAYYLVWTFWFPQHFEHLGLRLLGAALCLPGPWAHRLMTPRWRAVYLFTAVTYVLPFFFTFMYLMNHGAPVWAQTMLIGVTVLFHFPACWALCSFAIGVGCACLLFALVGDAQFLLSHAVLEQLPLYLFTIVVVSVAKVGRRVLAQEKLAGMAHGLATVSHELRTPLLSVDANARGIARRLARGAGYGGAGSSADRDATQDAAERQAMRAAMARIQHEVRHMNHMIDLFLLSATAVNERLEASEVVSMQQAVDGVIARYPFATEAQRAAVTVEVRGDFHFAGTYELTVVILLNLLRNAQKALHRGGKGRIRILIDGARARPRLLFIDTGCGIAPQRLPHIFKRFYSWPASAGSGIGLALCKDIVEAWEGTIRCVSRESAYTLFVLQFPVVAAAPSNASARPSTASASAAIAAADHPSPVTVPTAVSAALSAV